MEKDQLPLPHQLPGPRNADTPQRGPGRVLVAEVFSYILRTSDGLSWHSSNNYTL